MNEPQIDTNQEQAVMLLHISRCPPGVNILVSNSQFILLTHLSLIVTLPMSGGCCYGLSVKSDSCMSTNVQPGGTTCQAANYVSSCAGTFHTENLILLHF